MSDPRSSVARDADRPVGPAYFYPGEPEQPSEAPAVTASRAAGIDADAVLAGLTERLGRLGVGHTLEVMHGASADGVVVRSPYAEPVTVVENDGRFALVARGADGGPAVIDTEIAADDSLELLSLYLAFHTLWAMKRTVDVQGAQAVARRTPDLLSHQQLVMAFIAASLASPDDAVRSYAGGLMGSAATMLRS